MQTSKYLLAAGVLAAVILPLQVQGGPDSDEQSKMREALRRALEQPGAPQTQPAPAPKPIAAPPPAEPAPATPTPQPQPQAQPAPVTPVAPPPVTPTVVVQTPQTFEPVPGPDDAANITRAREAMRQKMLEMQTTPQPAPASTPAAEPGKSVAAVTPPPASKPATSSEPTPAPKPAAKPAPAVATSNYKPIDAPASPFSASKQAKLSDLLARYRADAITAQEYHAQRAAILAEQ